MLQVPDKASAHSEETLPERIDSRSLAREAEGTISTPPTIIYQQQKQTPYWVFFGCIVAMVALLSYGVGAMITLNNQAASSASTTASSSSSMSGTSASTDTSNVPDATQNYGDQLAPYTIDPDGARHFTLTASQVMWNVTGGQRVLAWAINGTVPGPQIHVTAGDHVRIAFINHFPKPTSIHWHGLQVSTQEDGVPGVGQPPIQPGQTYVYDFMVTDQDVGTHWYHSHYDDLEQLGSGFYGGFIVDPRPGTPQMAQAIHADVTYDEFIGSMGAYYTISGKSFPDTQPITVKHGQTVHLRLFGVDVQNIHPMHLHGHTFQIVAEDGHPLTQPISKDTIQVAPGETYDLVFTAWSTKGMTYPFHCHILAHLMNPGQTGDEMGGLITLVKYV